MLGEVLEAWLQIACLAYAAGRFETVSKALVNARAVYGELTTAPTAARFGPWSRG